MRKCAYSIVLLALVYSIGTLGVFSGYYTVYHRLAFQSQVKETSENKLEKIIFTEKEYRNIHWFDDESEFEWQGKMYDVSKITKTRDGYVIVCEQDSFEEILLSLVSLTKEKGQQGLKKGIPQPQIFACVIDLVPHFGVPLTNNFKNLELLYFSIEPEISSPPPRLASL